MTKPEIFNNGGELAAASADVGVERHSMSEASGPTSGGMNKWRLAAAMLMSAGVPVVANAQSFNYGLNADGMDFVSTGSVSEGQSTASFLSISDPAQITDRFSYTIAGGVRGGSSGTEWRSLSHIRSFDLCFYAADVGSSFGLTPSFRASHVLASGIGDSEGIGLDTYNQQYNNIKLTASGVEGFFLNNIGKKFIVEINFDPSDEYVSQNMGFAHHLSNGPLGDPDLSYYSNGSTWDTFRNSGSNIGATGVGSFEAVPEPGTALALGLGVGSLLGLGRRRKPE